MPDGSPISDERAAYRALLRDRFVVFFEKCFRYLNPGTPYKHNWHVDLLCDKLEAVERGEIKRLIINIQPRHLKSTIVSVAFTAWCMGRNPAMQILAGSYAETLAIRDNVNVRKIVTSAWFRELFPRFQLAGDQNEKRKFQTSMNGHRMAVGVGGSATGEGGSLLIVDDPVNPKQARSDAERSKANEWFDQTFSTRLNDPVDGAIVIIMQRLHMDDLTGHVLKKEPGRWEHVRLPGVAEEDECHKLFNGRNFTDGRKVVKRKKGEYLHPGRYTKDAMESLKATLGSWGFAGQIQQRPAPDGGGIVQSKWFMRYDERPDGPQCLRLVQSWDTASKDKEVNDPSACCTFLQTRDRYYLLHVWKDRLVYPELKKKVAELWNEWRKAYPKLPIQVIVEDKGSGQSLVQDIKAGSDPIPITPVDPTPQGNKAVRLGDASVHIENGRLFLPRQAPWLADYEEELTHFPEVPHDDQCDATSQGILYMASNGVMPTKGLGTVGASESYSGY